MTLVSWRAEPSEYSTEEGQRTEGVGDYVDCRLISKESSTGGEAGLSY